MVNKNIYHPFRDQDQLDSLSKFLDAHKPRNMVECALGVVAKWHAKNPMRGLGGGGNCWGCKLYLADKCEGCFMVVNGEGCNTPLSLYSAWGNLQRALYFEHADRAADLIFDLALRSFEAFAGGGYDIDAAIEYHENLDKEARRLTYDWEVAFQGTIRSGYLNTDLSLDDNGDISMIIIDDSLSSPCVASTANAYGINGNYDVPRKGLQEISKYGIHQVQITGSWSV